MSENTPIMRILELARWAPSGDNTQPWRFQIIDELHFNIITHDTRDWCVYDLDGKASILAVGTLLENISIAATAEALSAEFKIINEAPDSPPTIAVTLLNTPRESPHPLLPFITERVTQRRPLNSQALTEQQKQVLEASVGEKFKIFWAEKDKKWDMARLLFRSSEIHLSIPEGYEVHKRIIDWDKQFSPDKIPDQAVGLDPIAIKSMKWAIKSWKRVDFLNKYCAGTLLPRIQLSFLPGLKCAAHFLIVAENKFASTEDYLEGGRALQRFWLTATSLGLLLQPEMACLIFSRFALMSKNFTQDKKALTIAAGLPAELKQIFGDQNENQRVFMGRLGTGKKPQSRSIRLAVKNLLQRT